MQKVCPRNVISIGVEEPTGLKSLVYRMTSRSSIPFMISSQNIAASPSELDCQVQGFPNILTCWNLHHSNSESDGNLHAGFLQAEYTRTVPT